MLGNHPQVADYVKVEEEARKERVRTTYVSAKTSIRGNRIIGLSADYLDTHGIN